MSFAGTNIVDVAVEQFLHGVNAGVPIEDLERQHVDAKEEPGRRAGTAVLPGPADLEETARLLWPELACMGNTRDGGAIILGLSKDGSRPGVTVDPSALRRRVYELSSRQLTVNADEAELDDGTQLLVLRVPEQLEPIRVEGVIRWRYDDSCQEVDASTWHATIGLRGRDWSRERATETLDDIDDDAIPAIRHFLRASGEPARQETAELPQDELLRRLPNLVATDDHLTRAGRLLLTRLEPAITYVHRDRYGGDATFKLQPAGPLLAQLREVLAAIDARGQVTHVQSTSGAIGQFKHLPSRAVREAIVNGICHRDWHDPVPTTIEQVGQTLRITSPGDLVGSVTPDNIITHRSEPRYPALAEALTHIRVAEREGVGVDRMYGDMLAIGHAAPEIIDGNGAVEVALLGGPPTPGWITLRTHIDPLDGDDQAADDLRSLMTLHTAASNGWVSATSLAPVLQTRIVEASHALAQAARLTLDGSPVLVPISGRPDSSPPAFRLGPEAAEILTDTRTIPADVTARAELLVRYAQDAGRVSSTEAGHLLDIAPQTAIDALSIAEQTGRIGPSSPAGRGRGFHYLPVRD